MKKTFLTILLLSSPAITLAAIQSCSEQLADISAKSEMARNSGNSAEVSRLEIARNKVQTYCSDGRQARQATHNVSKKELKVKKAELELQQAQQELAEAKEEGRLDRISQKTHKVEEKKLKLESAKIDLKEAQDDAERLN